MTRAAALPPLHIPAATAFAAHWPDYLKEAGGLLVFMLAAGAAATVFEHPASPVHTAIPSDIVRRAGIGAIMAAVITGLAYSPWGKRTGTHLNPAVTLALYRLGRIDRWDALFYIIAQFAGAIAATPLLLAAIGPAFTHESVNYATTQPGPMGIGVAFAAEFAISFVMMAILLELLGNPRRRKLAGAAIAALVFVYVIVETPLSGMSFNPARSFGAALTSGQWPGIFLYFAAPVTAMLLAAELYRGARPGAGDLGLPHHPVEMEPRQ